MRPRRVHFQGSSFFLTPFFYEGKNGENGVSSFFLTPFFYEAVSFLQRFLLRRLLLAILPVAF